MSRTNIDLDDALVERVMKLYRLNTKKDAVNYALRVAAGAPMTLEEILAMEGSGWDGDLDELRGGEDPVELL